MICRATVAVHDLYAGQRVEVNTRDPAVKKLIAAGYLVPERKKAKA